MKRPSQPRAFRPGLVTFVVPAKDEAPALGEMLRSLPLSTLRLAGFDTEVLVLDGHSRDGTRDIAYDYREGATIVFDRERGKGAAFRNARRLIRGDYVVMIDADGTYAPDAVPRLLDPLAWGDADVVMGDRQAQPGALSGAHRVGNMLLSLAARLLYGRPCPDLCTGLWAFRGDVLRTLPLQSQRFELEAELFAVSTRLDLRIAHADVDYLARKGATKLSSRDALGIGWCLLRTRVRRLEGVGQTLPAASTHSTDQGTARPGNF